MKKSKGLLFFLCLTCFLGCNTYRPAYLSIRGKNGEKIFASREAFLKDFALCYCISQSMKKDGIQLNDKSVESFYDISDNELSIANSGQIIAKETEAYLRDMKQQPGVKFENRETIILDCINYYKSKQLTLLVDSVARIIKKGYKK